MTKEEFDFLLTWLSRDGSDGAEKYTKLHLRLVKLFICWHRAEAERLADETMNRVAEKGEQFFANYVGPPEPYLISVARNICREDERKNRRSGLLAPLPPIDPTEAEQRSQCLDQCMAKLPEQKQELVYRYYQGNKQEKIKTRQKLARELGITLDALRIRSHRIRLHLKACMERCLADIAAN